jgi:hypothetical protein
MRRQRYFWVSWETNFSGGSEASQSHRRSESEFQGRVKREWDGGGGRQPEGPRCRIASAPAAANWFAVMPCRRSRHGRSDMTGWSCPWNLRSGWNRISCPQGPCSCKPYARILWGRLSTWFPPNVAQSSRDFRSADAPGSRSGNILLAGADCWQGGVPCRERNNQRLRATFLAA